MEIKKINKNVETLTEFLKDSYLGSEVTSGEFIIGEVLCGSTAEAEVREAVQAFLDWDESPQTFDVKKNSENNWVIIG